MLERGSCTGSSACADPARHIGEPESDLLRVLGPVKELTRIRRFLTTAELRRQARVATFFDYIVEETEALRSIITG